ncbi:protein of unknown function [Magnetospirillum sp. XM-1]|uniref:hypothetical protein n=1 Tax=Magnetospirillum sp. XM-1 TaxID=1663591 RepID=UPI00073DC137|nr:hypothetical protein [Magnetospirillum sp. XM-1]CUW40254.1 protein of unknown function [Magnetospirillum sp. XM-1]
MSSNPGPLAIDICNQASILVGCNPITSFTEGTTEALVAAAIYDTTVEAALASYPWRFATTQVALMKLSAAPVDVSYSYAYQQPSDLVLPVRCTWGGNLVTYDRVGQTIVCNSDNSGGTDVVLTYIRRVSEDQWLPHFKQGVLFDLASLFAEAVAGRQDLSQSIMARAQKAYAVARSQESQSQANTDIPTSMIIQNRFGSSSL